MNNNESIAQKLDQRRYITDGGLETTLVFTRGMELPHFAAFPLLESDEGREILEEYYLRYAAVAEEAGCGFIFESPTWRAHPVWGEIMDYGEAGLDRVNRAAIEFLQALRDRFGGPSAGHLVSGCIGPRGDGYVVDHAMSAAQARDYHAPQVSSFAAAGADMTTAMTLNYAKEAIGIVSAANEHELPAVISFTTETDGRLPDGTSLRDAIEHVDAESDGGPLYYMVNCAHPDHFSGALEAGESWVQRLGGLRANASRMSHAELDNSDELDDGNPVELGQQLADLQSQMPHIRVLGGCCGTDHRHVGHMCGVAVSGAG